MPIVKSEEDFDLKAKHPFLHGVSPQKAAYLGKTWHRLSTVSIILFFGLILCSFTAFAGDWTKPSYQSSIYGWWFLQGNLSVTGQMSVDENVSAEYGLFNFVCIAGDCQNTWPAGGAVSIVIDNSTAENCTAGYYMYGQAENGSAYCAEDQTSAGTDFTDSIEGNTTMLQLAMMNNLSSSELNGTINDRWAANYNVSVEGLYASGYNVSYADAYASQYNVTAYGDEYNVSYADAYASQYNVTAYGDAYNVSYFDIYALAYNFSFEEITSSALVNGTINDRWALNYNLSDSLLYPSAYNLSDSMLYPTAYNISDGNLYTSGYNVSYEGLYKVNTTDDIRFALNGTPTISGNKIFEDNITAEVLILENSDNSFNWTTNGSCMIALDSFYICKS